MVCHRMDPSASGMIAFGNRLVEANDAVAISSYGEDEMWAVNFDSLPRAYMALVCECGDDPWYDHSVLIPIKVVQGCW